MKVGVALIALVLAAGSEHAAGRMVDRPPDNFPEEAKLPGSNHVLDAWYVIEGVPSHFGDVVPARR